jgi:hypothetical protein
VLTKVGTVRRVIAASVLDALDGRCTMDFTVMAETAATWTVGYVLMLHVKGDFYEFNVTTVHRYYSGGLYFADISGEQVTYVLNNAEFDIESFDSQYPPVQILTILLLGTNVTPGQVDFTDEVHYQINKKCSRRQAVMNFVAFLGGEIEYDGGAVNIRRRRGSTAPVEVMDGKTVSSVAVTENAEGKQYELTFFKALSIHTGDNIHIMFTPLGIDETTRILAMTFDPFRPWEITVEVGEYSLAYDDSLYQIENKVAEIAEKVEVKAWDLPIQSQYDGGTDIEAGNSYVVAVTEDETTGKFVCKLAKDEGGGGSFADLLSKTVWADILPVLPPSETVTNMCFGVVKDSGTVLKSTDSLTFQCYPIRNNLPITATWDTSGYTPPTFSLSISFDVWAGNSAEDIAKIGTLTYSGSGLNLFNQRQFINGDTSSAYWFGDIYINTQYVNLSSNWNEFTGLEAYKYIVFMNPDTSWNNINMTCEQNNTRYYIFSTAMQYTYGATGTWATTDPDYSFVVANPADALMYSYQAGGSIADLLFTTAGTNADLWNGLVKMSQRVHDYAAGKL